MGARPLAVLVVLVAAMGAGAAATAHVTADRQHAAAVATASAAAEQRRQAALTRQQRGGTSGFQDPVGGATAPRSTARPVAVLIPSIGVDSVLEKLHRDDRGVLQAPHYADQAGWWAGGIVPGQVGAAVIVGHVDTIQGPAVFVHLQQLRPGDLIEVRMSDGSTVRFTVDRSSVVDKALFPSKEVYGATPDAQLRLITCNEPFDPVLHSYTDNLVVFATERA